MKLPLNIGRETHILCNDCLNVKCHLQHKMANVRYRWCHKLKVWGLAYNTVTNLIVKFLSIIEFYLKLNV